MPREVKRVVGVRVVGPAAVSVFLGLILVLEMGLALAGVLLLVLVQVFLMM